MTQQYDLPPFPEALIGPCMSCTEVRSLLKRYGERCVEADRQRRQSEAEEVCDEAYQVVGALLDDLGMFETDEAKKILDNLSQARIVHKDVLPWKSADVNGTRPTP